MKRTASLIVACLAACAVRGQENFLPLKLGEDWKLFLKVEAPRTLDRVPASLPSRDGKPIASRTARLKDDSIDLGALAGGKFESRDMAVLYNEFSVEKPGSMRIGVAADYWLEAYANGDMIYSTMAGGNGGTDYTPDAHVFTFPVKAGKNLLAVKVLSGADGWRFVCGTPRLQGAENVKFEPDAVWKVVDMKELQVKAGSALDQSSLAAMPKEGGFLAWLGLTSPDQRLPRLGIGPTGKLVAGDVPARLRGMGINYPWVYGDAGKDERWKDTWRDNAITARRQGYNLVRTGFDVGVDGMAFQPEIIDKADYLTSQLGARGLYTYLISNVYLRHPWDPGTERQDYALRLYLGDPAIRKAWKHGADTLMNHVNSYTGLAWKDDPNIACVELYNEQEWGFFHPKAKLAPETRAEFDAKFQAWLEAKYQNPAALAKAWGDASLDAFAKVSTPESFPSRGEDTKTNDFLLFCAELSRQNLEWMEETLRAAGYKGLVAQYNLSHWLGGLEAKYEGSQVSIANTYHNHPSSFMSPGSRTGQNSSVGGAAGYWRGIASMRFADRPFCETEFNHAMWNPYQHECGAVFGAYSAFQGFDALIIHEGASFFRAKDPLDCFNVGRSPVVRANEFLSGCLFLRGDVKASSRRVELDIPKEYLETNGNSGRGVSGEQNKLALLTGFSVSFPWAKRPAGVGNPPKPDLVLAPANGSQAMANGGGWAVNSIDAKDAKFSLDAAVACLRAKAILPEANLSDPARGVFQSDTGEITMRTKENLLKIATPRSEAVTLEGGKGELVGQLEVLGSDVSALVAACAVDQEALGDSKRVVLIYATEVANSGMELSPDRVTLVKLGTQPVLMKTGKLAIKLKNANAAAMSLYALGFDGARREKLPLRFKDGVLEIALDTAALKDGPTPFFELSVED